MNGPVSTSDFGILLGMAYQRFVVELNEHLVARGFTEIRATYGYVFRALADGEMTTAQLATKLGITNQGMAKIVNEMSLNGYLEKEVNARDGREKLLRLSPRGREALKTARAFHASFERRLGKDGAVLRELLGGIVERDQREDDLARVLRPF